MSTKTTISEADGPPAKHDAARGSGLLVMSLESFTSLPLPGRSCVTIGRSSKCDVRLDDPLASRRHARLNIGETFTIEDLHSANGTRVRDQVIPPGAPVAVTPGEAIGIGSTVLVLHQSQNPLGRRLWSHRHFETQLGRECARAGNQGPSLAVARISLDRAVSRVKVLPLLDREVRPPHLFAGYAPNEYELLLLGFGPAEAERLQEKVTRSLADLGATPRFSLAWYPRDGRTADSLLAHANAALRRRPIGADPVLAVPSTLARPMLDVYELASRAARANINILILGETGTGKEVMAQTVHRQSARSGRALVALNCAGLSESLIESELFGHERGAFTGALQARRGLFEAADGGTLFLDEVGEMPMSMQPRLLRALASREILPVGATKPRPLDVRLVCATNRDLEAEVSKGTFREDLFYRLNGMTLTLPPLRERKSEIEPLTDHFVADAARSSERAMPRVSAEVRALLLDYDWPGNIRELKNVVERAVVLSEGDTIGVEHLPFERMLPRARAAPGNAGAAAVPPRALTAGEEIERNLILRTLKEYVWNQSESARALNMPRRTFVSKLSRYGIPRPQKRGKAPPLPNPDSARKGGPGNDARLSG